MCAGVRNGTLDALPRTQSSIAVSRNQVDWLLINASPDIRTQLNTHPLMQPGRDVRDTGVRAVMLADSQIDHTTGLLILRESRTALELYCTDSVCEDLSTGFPVLNMLSHYCGVNRHMLACDGSSTPVAGVEGLRVTAVALSSKAPPYSPHRNAPTAGDNVGLFIEDVHSGSKLFYAPGLGQFEPHLEPFCQQADCLLVDGTCWTDDEMARRGVGSKLASQMGHLAQSGPGGMIEQLARFPQARRILIHINNTNPILDENSGERAILAEQGIEVAFDGMLLTL